MLPSSVLCPGLSDQEEANFKGTGKYEVFRLHSFTVVSINIVKKQIRHDERENNTATLSNRKVLNQHKQKKKKVKLTLARGFTR